MSLHLRILGGLSVDHNGVPTALAGHRTSLALLAVIAAAPNGGITRERLQAIFWPEANEDRARNALKQRLFALRRSTGEENLLLDGAEVRLNSAAIVVDLWEFDAAAKAGDADRAAELYAGPFLDGVHVGDSPELERWIEDQRVRVAERARHVFMEAARQHTTNGRHERAVIHWRLLARMDPTSSTAALGLVEALRDSGNRAAALNHARIYESLVREELGIEPESIVAEAARQPEPLRPAGAQHDAGNTIIAELRVDGNDKPASNRSASPEASRRSGTPSGGTRNSGKRAAYLLAAAALLAMVVAWYTLRPGVESDDVQTVVVTPFVNLTDDSTWNAFSDVASVVLSEGLQRRGVANVLDVQSRLKAGLRQANAEASGDTEKLAELARQAGATHIVTGSYQIVDSQMMIVATVRTTSDPAPLKFAQEIGALDQPMELLGKVDERLAGVFATLVDKRITARSSNASAIPTYAAYVEYVRGLNAFAVDNTKAATMHFARAYALDSTFIGAVPLLVTLTGSDSAMALLERLQRRRNHLEPFDRYQVDFWRAFRTGKRDSMYVAAQEMVRLAPRAPDAHWAMGFSAASTKRYKEATSAFDSVRKLGGWTENKVFSAVRWQTVALHMQGNARRNLELVRQLSARFPFDPEMCSYELQAMAFETPVSEMEKRITTCNANSGGVEKWGQALMRQIMAGELIAHGRSDDARRLVAPSLVFHQRMVAETRAAVLRNRTKDAEVDALQAQRGLAFALLWAGEWGEALAMFEKVLAQFPNPQPQMLANTGVAAARSGNLTRADELLARLPLGEGGGAATAHSHFHRARIFASMGRREEAMRELVEAERLGLAAAELFHADVGLLSLVGYEPYETFMRGR